MTISKGLFLRRSIEKDKLWKSTRYMVEPNAVSLEYFLVRGSYKYRKQSPFEELSNVTDLKRQALKE